MLSLLVLVSLLVPLADALSSTSLPYDPPRTTPSPNQLRLPSQADLPHTWVPIASTFELDPGRPNAVQFYNNQYVAYRGENGQWTVVDDACPHRLAPLSEGRVNPDTGRLECSYHGWSFDSSGQCTHIPQADPVTETAALASPRCTVKSYPVAVEKNILFVWPWPEDPLTIVGDTWKHPEHMCAEVAENCTTYTRDLPYGWDTLLENIVDPSHVPFAHHGLQGKRTDAIPVNMTQPSEILESGFSFDYGDRTMSMRRAGTGVFRAPYTIQYKGEFEKKAEAPEEEPPRFFDLTALMIPTKPGWSRILLFGGSREKKVTDDSKQKERLVQKLFRILPIWLLHIVSNRFLDSDLMFLHEQEQERQRRGLPASDATDGYFLPAKSDRSILSLRKWIGKFASVPGPLPPAISDRSALFDRWAQHSDQCQYCHGAVKGIAKWRKNTYRALALSVLLAKYTAARVSIVACLVVLRMLAWIEPALKTGGFSHYDNH